MKYRATTRGKNQYRKVTLEKSIPVLYYSRSISRPAVHKQRSRQAGFQVAAISSL